MEFVQAMNNNMALKSKENEFQLYKIGTKDFEKIAAFKYTVASTKSTIKYYIFELMILTMLAILLSFFVNQTSKKLIKL